MKKLFASILFALTLISTSVSFAKSAAPIAAVNEPLYFGSNVYVEPDALKLNVAIDKEIGTHVQIKIIDPNGMAILYHQVDPHVSSTHTRLDLSALANGLYELVISDDESEIVKEFTIKTAPSENYRGIVLNMF